MVFEHNKSDIRTKKQEVPKYQISKLIGKGSYGEVYDIKDAKSHIHYALKKCMKIFETKTRALGTLTELRLGRLLNHRNINKLEEILIPYHLNSFGGIYYRSKLMKTNLGRYLNRNKYIPIKDIKYILFQMISALYYIHKRGVIHCDIKPDNILIGSNKETQLCDFGLSHVINPSKESLQSYATTRWYRAPEVILGMKYNEAIDIWSIGCVLGELLLGKPLFQGTNNFNQLDIIMDTLGCPEDLSWVDASQRVIFAMNKNKKNRFDEIFSGCDESAVRLLSHMLLWNPKERYTAQQILYDLFFQDIDSETKREYQCINENQPIDPIIVDFDRKNIKLEDIRKLIIEEIKYYHPIH